MMYCANVRIDVHTDTLFVYIKVGNVKIASSGRRSRNNDDCRRDHACAQHQRRSLQMLGYTTRTRAVRRRTGGRRRRWVVLRPAAAARRAFFIGGAGGVAIWSAAAASAASDRTREHWNSALAEQAFFSGFTGVIHFTCDLC